jgi:hypothetical protein
MIVAVDGGLASTHFFAANPSPGQQQAMNRSSRRLQPVYRELSGLDEDVLDQLLADDGDALSSQPLLRHASLGANDGHSAGLDPAVARGPGAGGAGGAPSSALGQGTQDAGTPDLANEMNSGLVGGAGGASPQAATSSTSSLANTLTEAAFAQGAAANAVSNANGLEPNGNNSEIVVVSSATDAYFFTLVGNSYVPQFYIQDQLTHNTSTGEFIFTDTLGDQLHFFDWSGSQANQ